MVGTGLRAGRVYIAVSRLAGLLHPTDPAQDAWFIMKLVVSVFHHYAFATAPERVEDIAEHLWAFCLAAVGGAPDSAPRAAR